MGTKLTEFDLRRAQAWRASTTETPTTRRYPRSLAEAFADERASAIEGPRVIHTDTSLGARLARAVHSFAQTLRSSS